MHDVQFTEAPFADPLTRRITGFLEEIGIPVEPRRIDTTTFLPGILIEDGRIYIDQEKLLYPGDLLHEAGHIAVLTAEERRSMGSDVGQDLGLEIGAIAWSWAALSHLGIPPDVVFHSNGYRGSSQAFIENFSAGHYVGVPLLQWMGLTHDEKKAEELGVEPFPRMVRWLRE